MFWIFSCGACGILAPWPGTKLTALALEGKVLTLLDHEEVSSLVLFWLDDTWSFKVDSDWVQLSSNTVYGKNPKAPFIKCKSMVSLVCSFGRNDWRPQQTHPSEETGKRKLLSPTKAQMVTPCFSITAKSP